MKLNLQKNCGKNKNKEPLKTFCFKVKHKAKQLA